MQQTKTFLIRILIAIAVLMTGMAYTGTVNASAVTEPEVSEAAIYADSNGEKISVLEVKDAEMAEADRYLFLPSEAQSTVSLFSEEEEKTVCFGDSAEEKKETAELTEMTADDNGRYVLPVMVIGPEKTVIDSFPLYVMKGENIGTVFYHSADSANYGREWIEVQKSNRGSGTAKVVNENGKVKYDGKISDIHVRGNTSMRDPKKGYQIKLDKKTALVGDQKGKKWVLLSQYKDPLKISDMICKNIAAISGDTYAASAAMVNFYYDGQYRGVYQLSEKNEVNSNRIDINDMEDFYKEQDPDYGDTVTPKVEENAYGNRYKYQKGLEGPEEPGGFLLEMDDQYMDEDNGFMFRIGEVSRHVKIDAPELGSRSAVKYISEYFQEFSDAVSGTEGDTHTGKNPQTGLYYYDYCDADSLVNTCLLQTVTSNTDSFWKSQYFYKDVNKKMVAGPVWDMDMTFGTGWGAQTDPAVDLLKSQTITRDLIRIPGFQKLLKERYQNHYQGVLESLTDTGESLPTFMETYQKIKGNLPMDGVLWPAKMKIGSDWVSDEQRQWEEGTTFDDIAAYRVDWLKKHKQFLDAYFAEMNPAEDHLYGEAVAKDASCHERTCEWCGHILSEEHVWDAGTILKEATADEEGECAYRCRVCGEMRTETIPQLNSGEAGTGGSGTDDNGTDAPAPAGPESSPSGSEESASGEAGDSETQPAQENTEEAAPVTNGGNRFSPLRLGSKTQGKKSVTLTWSKLKKADKYTVYGSLCGKNKEMKKIKTLQNNQLKVKKIGKSLAQGRYYRFVVVAQDSNGNALNTSRIIYVATKGGKAKNYTKVTVKKAKVTLKKGKAFRLGGKAVGKNVKTYRALAYESSNSKVASVTKKGVIKAKGKGRCIIYAYAQNGIYKKIAVTVK